MPIHKKILAVMKDVDYLMKDDNVAYQSTRYMGLREEIVTTKVRDAMVKHNLIVFPIKQEHRREPIGSKGSVLSILDITYRFVDTEDDTFIEVVSSGTGADTQDKGVGKAMTYAFKYVFLRTFAIPTGEDPDRISSAELDDKDAKRKTTKPENGATTAQVEKVTKERADKAWRHMKQMMVDYENVMPIAELNSIQEEMGQVKTIEDAMKLYGRFKAATRRFEIESGKDKEGFQYE
ncbi:hypothetical protein LCGC14_1816900 [marine sediment metagenome]|uniref:ERF family protein n=1 Tax=marine sediment metagenome TaxID=412755 RepID=A0A0F9H869_9ZZZZ